MPAEVAAVVHTCEGSYFAGSMTENAPLTERTGSLNVHAATFVPQVLSHATDANDAR